MSEPSLSVMVTNYEIGLGRLRERVRRMFPFLSGMLAALLALFLYNLSFPGSKPLTQNEVNTAISSAMASATPRPAYSTQVYQIIQPSLVWIETEGAGSEWGGTIGLGTGRDHR